MPSVQQEQNDQCAHQVWEKESMKFGHCVLRHGSNVHRRNPSLHSACSAAKRGLPCKVMNTTVFNYTIPQGYSQLGVQQCSLSDIFMFYAFMTVALTTQEHAICGIVVNFSTTVVLSAMVLTRVEHGCSPL